MTVLETTIPTILLVDDAPPVLSVLERSLKLLFPAYRIIAASDADQALSILAESPAVVMITDLLMPGIDGSMLSSMVRHMHPSTFIILATAHFDPISASSRIHIDACLHKPFPLNQLEALVRQGIEHNQQLEARMVGA